jgi:hypothetical protein
MDTSSALNRSRSARPTAQKSSVWAGRLNFVTTDSATSPQLAFDHSSDYQDRADIDSAKHDAWSDLKRYRRAMRAADRDTTLQPLCNIGVARPQHNDPQGPNLSRFVA